MTEKEIISAMLTAAILGSQKKKEEAKEEKTDYRKVSAEIAKELYESYLGFQDAGFTPEQAFQLLLAMKD